LTWIYQSNIIYVCSFVTYSAGIKEFEVQPFRWLSHAYKTLLFRQFCRWSDWRYTIQYDLDCQLTINWYPRAVLFHAYSEKSIDMIRFQWWMHFEYFIFDCFLLLVKYYSPLFFIRPEVFISCDEGKLVVWFLSFGTFILFFDYFGDLIDHEGCLLCFSHLFVLYSLMQNNIMKSRF